MAAAHYHRLDNAAMPPLLACGNFVWLLADPPQTLSEDEAV
jgi:hypothetical protein